MGPTGDRYRVIQVHPTRRCNLECLHCYSSSGPGATEALPLRMVLECLEDAAAEGYNVAGFSGGEPVLYADLRAALEHARGLGMTTTVTSNGMLLDERRVDLLTGVTDLLAISLDGRQESHDRMRGSDRAFSRMSSCLETVRASGIPFGFVFTLTQHNVDELRWAASFAIAQGATLLQIHPLEETGRAATELVGSRPDEREAAMAFLEAQALQELVGDELRIHLDFTDRRLLREEPERALLGGEANEAEHGSGLAWRVAPLIVEPDGTVVPIQYGFDRRYALGNLHDDRLASMVPEWRERGLESLHELSRSVYEEVVEERPLPFFNWYEVLAARAADRSSAARRAG